MLLSLLLIYLVSPTRLFSSENMDFLTLLFVKLPSTWEVISQHWFNKHEYQYKTQTVRFTCMEQKEMQELTLSQDNVEE